MTITYRPYTDADYEFVYQLKKLCYQGYVEAIWGPWNEADQRARFDGFIAAGGGETVILLDGETPIGMTNWEFPDEDTLDICNLCLLPQYRGRGIGSGILRAYIERSPKRTVALQVYKTNPARGLYERLGFRVYDETDTHYRMKLEKE